MPEIRRRLTSWGLCLGVFAIACGLAAYVARGALTGWAMRSALRGAGAEDIRLSVRDVSPRRVVVDDVGFTLHRQPVAAGRLTIARERWWAPTFGKVSVNGLRVPVSVAALKPAAGAPTPAAGSAAPPASPPKSIPAEEISIDGQLVVKAEGFEQALTVTLDAKLQPEGRWAGRVAADGPGLTLRAEADYRLATGELAFRVPTAHVDLKSWSGFVQRVIPLPGGGWTIEGRLDGTAAGTMAPGKSAATATVTLRDGAFNSPAPAASARGIDADLVFENVMDLKSAPGQTVRVAEIRAGVMTARELDVHYQLQGTDRVEVSQLTVQALGGRLATEPFSVVPSRSEFEATLLAESLSVEELLALAPDVPAKATGRVNGRLPIHLDTEGFRFGTGWLGLVPGVAAEVQFNAKGLLTRGLSTSNPRYTVLSQIEGGLLRLRLDELRLDVHPPDAPAGRTARLHLAGAPADPAIKAPVTLDLNVNGPFERLLNMGLDSRVKMGAPKP